MYCTKNFKTKKALKEAVASGEEVRVYQPGSLNYNNGSDNNHGTVAVEGPWYPAPHSWYAQVTVVNDLVVKVK